MAEMMASSTFHLALAEVKKFGYLIVRNARSRRMKNQCHDKSSKDHVAYGSLLDSLMDAFDDSTIVADAALNFLSAGRDTTAQSLTWTFYLLMRHPFIVQNIREEIAAAFPAHSAENGPLKLTAADLHPNNLPYTMAVFYESLRLYPPVPFEIKQCEVDVTLPDGTFLPAGSVVVWCVWAMNRSKEIWDTDDLETNSFAPERWLRDSKLTTKSAFEFPVFNGGPRSCLGKKMAELIAAYLIVNLVREFVFEEVKDKNDPEKERVSHNSLTLPMEGGLPCIVRSIQQ